MQILIDGFKNEETAQTFIDWYCEQGEQDIEIWLQCRIDEGLDIPDSLICYKSKRVNDNVLEMYIKQE